ncbi:hypothetical protein Droror1_Dr00013732 [Drosera rotundifolia]
MEEGLCRNGEGTPASHWEQEGFLCRWFSMDGARTMDLSEAEGVQARSRDTAGFMFWVVLFPDFWGVEVGNFGGIGSMILECALGSLS